MLGHGNTHAVIPHTHAFIFVNGHFDAVATAGQRLINRVIYNFVDEVMECLNVCAPDIHAGAAAHRF